MPLFFTSKETFQQEVAKQSMDVCEQIITEMGADLHDDLLQQLSILRLSIDRLERSVSDPREMELAIIKIKGEFINIIYSVRKVSRRFMPVQMEDDSFEQTVAMLCQNLERSGSGAVHFNRIGEEQQLTPIAEIYLYRMIQELINNSFKHSFAWHLWIRLIWTPQNLTVEVEDDGTGFSKIPEFISILRKKNNTLRMRCLVINATITYLQGKKGLLARISYSF
jgi:signal transduction histidine kinase